MAKALEDMPEVIRYVKNHNLGFTIPYTLNGEERITSPILSLASTTTTAPATCSTLSPK
jgi:hypothetical protein